MTFLLPYSLLALSLSGVGKNQDRHTVILFFDSKGIVYEQSRGK